MTTEATSTSDELFPAVARVHYRKAPLVQVACQVRFPPILRAETPPVDFQERIRKTFPLFERSPNFAPPQQLPPQVVQALEAQIGISGWRFLREDRSSTIALSTELLVLTTTTYTRWEDFLDLWRPAYSALLEIYKPLYFSAVSLRYQDFIDRTKIGLQEARWSELLRKELLGEAAIEKVEQHMEGASRALRLRIPDENYLMVLQHGLGKQVGSDQSGYFIDLDFAAIEKTEVKDAERTLTELHRNVGNAFRWCITTKLHEALEPIEFDNAIS